MARFIGEVQGKAKTKASRLGSEKSGLMAHVRGWNVGVFIRCEVVDGKDIIKIFRTNGSNDPVIGELITIMKED